ncbi:hypothetical protein IEQ34_022040 [Dendrobium chrysotoxum]|uniref:Uncharacterized protein n=1 Tax=Dendrobium chrysotoxum TaxID=161865 RepID=A0AAV7FWD1_DENCH|nr:hypothetical protein IEQ34_022040 [Dendrobium chrysotoxum]
MNYLFQAKSYIPSTNFGNVVLTTVTPPSITRLCPLIKAASSEAKNSTAVATSSALSTVPFSIAPVHKSFSTFATSIPGTPQTRGVATKYGDTQFTLTPFPPSSAAASFTSPKTACFAVM